MVLLLVLFPFLFSIIFFLLPLNLQKKAALLASCVIFLFSIYYIFELNPLDRTNSSYNLVLSSNPSIQISFASNGLNLLFVLLSSMLLPIIILSTGDRFYKNSRVLYALIFIMIGAMNGTFLSIDAISFYIFWELALIPIYFICAIWGGNNRIKVTLKFFLYTFIGSLFMFFAFIFLYLKTPGLHSFNLEILRQVALNGYEPIILFSLIFLAFAIKLPLFPFHSWQADTYVSAPTPGVMLLSGIMLKMGGFGAIVWLIYLIPLGLEPIQKLLITLSVIGVVYGALIAIRLKDIKRIFAWSSLSHVALIGAGILTYTHDGWQGSILQMFNHGINVIGLFLMADIIEKRFKTRDISMMGGIAKQAPKFTLFSMIIICGSLSVPLTNGFPGEFLLLKSIFDFSIFLSIVAGTTIIFSAVYLLRMMRLVFFGPENPESIDFKDVNYNESIALGFISFWVLFFGIYPEAVLSISRTTIQLYLQTKGF